MPFYPGASQRCVLLICYIVVGGMLPGCGGRSTIEDEYRGDDPAPDASTQLGQPTTEVTNPAALGLVLPPAIRETGQVLARVGTEAVFTASILATAGREIVATGTLTQAPDGQFTYESAPADRLRLVWSGGERTDFFVFQMQGDFSRDANHWLSSDHALHLRATSEGLFDLTAQSSQQNGQFSDSIVGDIQIGDTFHTAELTSSGNYTSVSDISSAEYQSFTSTQGVITNITGLTLEVNESRDYELISFDNTVTTEKRMINNRWTNGGNNYSLTDGMIRLETLNGWAHPSDYWVVQGEVLRDGQRAGALDVEVTEAWISIFLAVGAERFEIERFLRQQGG